MSSRGTVLKKVASSACGEDGVFLFGWSGWTSRQGLIGRSRTSLCQVELAHGRVSGFEETVPPNQFCVHQRVCRHGMFRCDNYGTENRWGIPRWFLMEYWIVKASVWIR
jgi:hypothetical protein